MNGEMDLMAELPCVALGFRAAGRSAMAILPILVHSPFIHFSNHCPITCDFTVRLSMRSTSTVTPSPGRSTGTLTMPDESIVHSGVTISRDQYRELGDTSPGFVKLDKDARATL